MMRNKDFAIFILTHKRSDRVITYNLLREKTNYTGKIYFILDDTDSEIPKYIENFGKENIIIFNKMEISKEFDIMDNFDDQRAVVFARNATFGIARELGLKYFMVLDDDYNSISYRVDRKLNFLHQKIFLLEEVIDLLLDFYKNIPAKSIALAQSGDYIGGRANGIFESITKIRKCMNTFICSPDREFKFIGRINEDVNTYTGNSRFGDIFLTIPFISINQIETQNNKGGLTDIYLNLGTYVKSFYSVLTLPSSIKVAMMNSTHRRLHHRVSGKNTYPMIIRETHI